jgi:SAM-dependent methyltransferase
MINPKDLINSLTVEDLCLTAENYFKTISDPTPQMAKPFSSLLECPEMLQNMGLLLSGLRLGKTMTVLDFGAGTSWFSRFLNQLQCQTISCDPSETALAIGKRLFNEFKIIGDYISEPLFLHFDGHKICLSDNYVDRIICYDVFHHIPNQEQVLSEFARVLRNGGIVGFSEPGRFHSQSPQSQYEMTNYNVLENDIDIKEICLIAMEHGFTDISCKLLCDKEISLDKYIRLVTDKCNMEFQKEISNNISNVMNNKTVFFLYKGNCILDSRSHIGLSHLIIIDNNSYYVTKGENLNLVLKISNTGSAKWLNDNIKDIGVVKVGSHLYDADNKLLNLDFSRHNFTSPILPGESVNKTICLKFNDRGVFNLSIDLVSEGICWFENVGSRPQYIKINVE